MIVTHKTADSPDRAREISEGVSTTICSGKARLVVGVLPLVASALIWSGGAGATVTPYWGYNNMTQFNPPASAGKCAGNPIDGIACSAWNYWDRSRIDYLSGSATIRVAMNNPGSPDYYGLYGSSPAYWTLVRVDWDNAHPDLYIQAYNRNACLWIQGTYAYIQCQGIIF
jgi:hypothetical protein